MSAGKLRGSGQLNAVVFETLSRADCILIDTEQKLEEVARLRYDAYRREEAVEPTSSRKLVDRFDLQPNSATFGIYISGRLAASIRIHVVDSDRPFSPAVDAFPEIRELLLRADPGKRLIDPNRFVVDQGMSRANPALPYVVLRLPFMAAEYLSADYATATVRREHEAFYGRVLGYQSILSPRPYPTLAKALGLMLVDFQSQKSRVLEQYPFFSTRLAEAETCFRSLRPTL